MPTPFTLPNNRIAFVAEAPGFSNEPYVVASDAYDYEFDNFGSGDWRGFDYYGQVPDDDNIYPLSSNNKWRVTTDMTGGAPFACNLGSHVMVAFNSNTVTRVYLGDEYGKNFVNQGNPFDSGQNAMYPCIIPIGNDEVLVVSHKTGTQANEYLLLRRGQLSGVDQSPRLTLEPTDDAFVKNNTNGGDDNFGSEPTLLVRDGGTLLRRSWLKFDVEYLPGTVTSAELHLYSNTINDKTVTVSSGDNGWDEGTLTWNNQPAAGSLIDSKVVQNGWNVWDVTSHVTGDGTYSFVVNMLFDGANKDFSSKEGANCPMLVIYHTSGGGNNPPTFNTDPINEVDATEDSAYSSTLADDASDPEGDPMTFFKTGGPAWLNVASNGALSGTPANSDVGLNVFTVQVDATGGSDTATLNITVLNTNDDPSFTSDPIVEVDATEDAAYSSTLADDATDPDIGDTLFFSRVTGPAWLTVAGDGTLSGMPTAGDVGLNSWTVQVDDDSAAFDQATLNISVDAAPPGPDQLAYEDFEGGFGIFTDGGGDCSLYTGGSRSHQGSNSMDIQDNSGDASAGWLTNGIDVSTPGYTQITVDFWFYSNSMDKGTEDFFVEYWDGSTWQNIATYVVDTDFFNGDFTNKSIVITSSQYTFPTDMKIKFRCDASGNGDDIYIDEVNISAE
jgi:hypothetical protein